MPDPTTTPPRIKPGEIHDADSSDLAAVLRAGAARQDANRRAALEALLGYNGGDLIGRRSVRRFLAVDVTGELYVKWRSLGDELNGDESDLFKIGSTGVAAMQLACALAGTAPADRLWLSQAVNGWDGANSRVMARAFATALGIRADDLAAAVRLDQREAQITQLRDLCEPNDNATPWGAAAMVRLATDDPMDHDPEARPLLAVAVADIRRIIDAPLVPHTRPRPLDADGLADLAVTILRQAGASGLTVAELVRFMGQSYGVNTTRLAVLAAIGLAASRGPCPIVQPEPHGRYYATEHAPPAGDVEAVGG